MDAPMSFGVQKIGLTPEEFLEAYSDVIVPALVAGQGRADIIITWQRSSCPVRLARQSGRAAERQSGRAVEEHAVK